MQRRKPTGASTSPNALKSSHADDTSPLASLASLSSAWTIVRWTVLHRFAVLALLLVSATLQQHSFDTSAALIVSLDAASPSHASVRRWAQHLVRWDTLHFLGVASPRALPSSSARGDGGGGGLSAEHSLAFQPAVLWLLRFAGRRSMRWKSSADSIHVSQQFSAADWSVVQSVLLTSLVATTVSAALPVLLYRLTLQTVQRHRTAKLAALLSILSTAPATLVTPTPESFFAFFALLGHVFLTRATSSPSRHPAIYVFATLLSSCMFGIACAFRANGILLLGFLPWHLLWITAKPSVTRPLLLRAILLVVALVLAIFLPLLSQIWANNRFCHPSAVATTSQRRPWCTFRIPIAYTFVQQHYWHVGFLRYWTAAQIPNWILAAPVLGLAARWLAKFYSADVKQVMRLTLAPRLLLCSDRSIDALMTPAIAAASGLPSTTMTVRNAPHVLGHAHYTLALLLLLTLASHVQIALRFATPGAMPVVWWSAAALIESWSPAPGSASGKPSSWSRICLAALVLWNAASVVLYAGFYPPA